MALQSQEDYMSSDSDNSKTHNQKIYLDKRLYI